MATKMKTEHAHKHGQTNVIPYAGVVTISKSGFIEVSSLEIAQKIEKANIGFSVVNEEQDPRKKKVESDEDKDEDLEDLREKSESSDLEEKDEDNLHNSSENEELIKGLDTPEMTLSILQGMAKSYPRKEWGAKNKADLIAYLKEKLA